MWYCVHCLYSRGVYGQKDSKRNIGRISFSLPGNVLAMRGKKDFIGTLFVYIVSPARMEKYPL